MDLDFLGLFYKEKTHLKVFIPIWSHSGGNHHFIASNRKLSASPSQIWHVVDKLRPSELKLREGTDDNSQTIFLISQQRHCGPH